MGDVEGVSLAKLQLRLQLVLEKRSAARERVNAIEARMRDHMIEEQRTREAIARAQGLKATEFLLS